MRISFNGAVFLSGIGVPSTRTSLSEIVALTTPMPRRPFQGWRYLSEADAPADLEGDGSATAMPGELARRLREFGVL